MEREKNPVHGIHMTTEKAILILTKRLFQCMQKE